MDYRFFSDSSSDFLLFLGGISGAKGAEIPQAVNEMLNSLDRMFNWNILLIVPLAIVLIGSIKKLPTIPVMLVASIVALINAGIFQGASLNDCINATINGFNVGMLGFEESSVSADLVKLLTRGGMMAMMNTLLIAICAISFAGTMTVTGSLSVLIDKLITRINSTFKLVLSTEIICLITTGVTSNGQVSILMPGEALKGVYVEKGLHPKVLSRTLEDSVTCTECLIPWTAAGAYMATTLGVPTLSYLPFAILNYSGLIFALLWAATGIGVTYLNKNKD